MRRLSLVALWAGLLGAAALYFGWTDGFHLGVGVVLLLFPAAVALWIRRHQAAEEVALDDELTPHPARFLLIHGACGLLCIGYLTGSFHLLHAAGYGISWIDHDRATLEDRLQVLEDAGQHDRAAELITERLSQRLSETWGHVLAERLYRVLVNAGKHAKDLDERRVRFAKAAAVAQQYQLDGTLAGRLGEECEAEIAYVNRITALRGTKDWQKLACLLEGGLLEDAPSRRHLPLGSWLRDCLLEWSRDLAAGKDKKEKLARALEVCAQHGLEDHAVRLAVALLDKEIQPIALPQGAKGGIVQVATDYFPPVFIADVWIDNAAGRPIEKLQQKDFQVRFGGRTVSDFVVHEENRDVVPMHLILAIDTSGSMKGPAIAAAESGSIRLVQGLHPLSEFHGQMWVKLLTFDSQITLRSQWTKDMHAASESLKGLNAEGGTALFKTVMHSVHEFKGRAGRKHLLLFTDGKDTDGGANVGSLVAVCKREGIAISAIGLRSDDLDVATLRRLSSETGGTYAEADGPQQLLEQFRQAGLRVRPHFYRLVVQPKGGTRDNLEIRVGGDNHLLWKGP